jgi:hypothetical protein
VNLERSRERALVMLVEKGTRGAQRPSPAEARAALRSGGRLLAAYDRLVREEALPWTLRLRRALSRVWPWR